MFSWNREEAVSIILVHGRVQTTALLLEVFQPVLTSSNDPVLNITGVPLSWS